MTIKEASKLTGVSIDNLRYYERIGLIPPVQMCIRDRPIAFNIAWYEQKAVIVLLSLLYLGVKNIHLGPTLPAFLSPNVAKVLVENFGIGGITNVEDDIKMFMEQ